MDFVITVCDKAAREVCPVWPGQPITAHWGFADPADASGSEAERKIAFADLYRELNTRLEILMSLPMGQIDQLTLQHRLREMGTQADGSC
jgi:hypothetical protein